MTPPALADDAGDDVELATTPAPPRTRPGRSIAGHSRCSPWLTVRPDLSSLAPDKLGDETCSRSSEKYSPRLGLDLEGGTSIILTPRVAPGETGKITRQALDRAVEIIRSRVDSFGVAEAEVTTAGNNIVISVPGARDNAILATVQQTAELRFRPVLNAACRRARCSRRRAASPSGTASPSPSASGSAPAASPAPSASTNGRAVPLALRAASTPSPTATTTPSPTAPADPSAGVTADIQKQFAELDCGDLAKVRNDLRTSGGDDPKKPLVTCLDDGSEKYLLGPAEVLGTDVTGADAALNTNSQGAVTGGWIVTLDFNGGGRPQVRRHDAPAGRPAAAAEPVRASCSTAWSSPRPGLNNGPITGGSAQITGDFTQQEARDLANVLKYGALPLSFDAGEVRRSSADARRRPARRPA